jgi:hypothetical protein
MWARKSDLARACALGGVARGDQRGVGLDLGGDVVGDPRDAAVRPDRPQHQLDLARRLVGQGQGGPDPGHLAHRGAAGRAHRRAIGGRDQLGGVAAEDAGDREAGPGLEGAVDEAQATAGVDLEHHLGQRLDQDLVALLPDATGGLGAIALGAIADEEGVVAPAIVAGLADRHLAWEPAGASDPVAGRVWKPRDELGDRAAAQLALGVTEQMLGRRVRRHDPIAVVAAHDRVGRAGQHQAVAGLGGAQPGQLGPLVHPRHTEERQPAVDLDQLARERHAAREVEERAAIARGLEGGEGHRGVVGAAAKPDVDPGAEEVRHQLGQRGSGATQTVVGADHDVEREHPIELAALEAIAHRGGSGVGGHGRAASASISSISRAAAIGSAAVAARSRARPRATRVGKP